MRRLTVRCPYRLCHEVSFGAPITIPQSPFPPGGDLIYLGIEPKIDRFCNEVSFGAPIPQSPPSVPNLNRNGITRVDRHGS